MTTPETEFGFYLNLGTILALVGSVGAGVWRFSRVEKAILDAGKQGDEELRNEMEAKFENVGRDVLRLERDNTGRAEIMRHETGEMGAALRAKIHEVEMFTRDTFVSKQSFEIVINRMEKMMDKLGDRLESKLDGMARRD